MVTRVLSRRFLGMGIVLGVLLTGCVRPAFTPGVRERFQFSPEEIRQLQFFTSDEIVLRREVPVQEATPSQQGLTVRGGTVVEEVRIPRHTACVALRVEGDFMLMGFAPDNPAKALWFGLKSREEDEMAHEERQFKLVQLENSLDETPFEPRYSRGYQLTYNGQNYQIADGKMWDVHLVYEEGSQIRQRTIETPPGWKQAR